MLRANSVSRIPRKVSGAPLKLNISQLEAVDENVYEGRDSSQKNKSSSERYYHNLIIILIFSFIRFNFFFFF